MRFGEAMRRAQGTDWVIPRYYKYLQGRRNHVDEAMHTAVLLVRPERDRTRSFSASGAGGCLRSRIFSWLNAPAKPHSDDTMAIFLNGHWVHMRHQVVGLTAGYLQAAEVPVNREDLNLRGTMDAIAIDGVPVEYKSINQNGFSRISSFGVEEMHLEQTHSYMLAGGYDSFRVVYENKNTNHLKEFHVKRDEAIIDKVMNDLTALNESIRTEELPEVLDECAQKTGRYRYCPFASVCLKANFQELKERLGTRATSSSESD